MLEHRKHLINNCGMNKGVKNEHWIREWLPITMLSRNNQIILI